MTPVVTPQEPVDVDLLVAAVTAVPGVVGLDAGRAGEVGTYLPGRRVAGIRTRPGSTEVHVVLGYGIPLRETAVRVQSVVEALTAGRVDVVVADVAVAGEPLVPSSPSH